MKKSLRVVTVLVALSVAFGCVVVGLAQTRPIVGGYKVAPKDDPEVISAAEFAVGAKGEKENVTIKLVSVEHAERQVVAGMNYRLCLKIEVAGGDDEEEADVSQEVKVVVYRNLKKEYSLRSWEPEECSESH